MWRVAIKRSRSAPAQTAKLSPYALESEQNIKFKPRNEDSAVAAVVRNRVGVSLLVGAVADGVSGLPHGDEASRLAVTGLLAEMRAGEFRDAAELAAHAGDIFARINAPIHTLGGGTTLTVAVVIRGRVVVMHLGDSSCSYFGADAEGHPRAIRMTRAHTLVAGAIQSGATDEEVDALHQHAIDRCLGDPMVEPQVMVDPAGIEPQRGRILIATDGVTDVWSQAELLLAAAHEKNAGALCHTICSQALVRLNAKGKSNKDNITCVILELEEYEENAVESESLGGAAHPNFATASSVDRGPACPTGARGWIERITTRTLVTVGVAAAAAFALVAVMLFRTESFPARGAPIIISTTGGDRNLSDPPKPRPSQANSGSAPQLFFTGDVAAEARAREIESKTNLTPDKQAVSPTPVLTKYTVVKGETYYKIAGKFGITVKALMEVNPEHGDPLSLPEGAQINLPSSSSMSPPLVPER